MRLFQFQFSGPKQPFSFDEQRKLLILACSLMLGFLTTALIN